MLFDRFIRPASQAPPLSEPFFLGRVSFSLMATSAWIIFGHTILMRPPYGDLASFAVYMSFFFLLEIWDVLSSNNFGINIKRLRCAGYSDGVLFVIMQSNLILSQMGGWFAMSLCQPETFTSLQVLDKISRAGFWLAVLFNIAIAEIFFTLCHSLMHTSTGLSRFHVLHHCCKFASFTTCLLFHPVDLAMEFGGPVACLLIQHFYLWQDPVLFYVTYLVFQNWYVLTHDAYVQRHHQKHHSENNAVYTIYTVFSGDAKANLMNHKIAALLRD